MHAMKFLKEAEQLVAIMSAHTEFAQSKQAMAFCDALEKLNASFDDLPADAIEGSASLTMA